MNRGEAMGIGAIASFASIVLYYVILYFFIFENFLIATKHVGYDLYAIETELWWLFFGFGLVLGLRAITKTYRWARRDYCNHCGKELKK